jgi:hypothetical protein
MRNMILVEINDDEEEVNEDGALQALCGDSPRAGRFQREHR